MAEKTKKDNTPSVEELFKAKVHLGHQTRRWSPRMAPFIYTSLKKTHLVNLEITKESLKKACDFLEDIKGQGKVIFVGTKRQARDLIEKYALEADTFYVSQRWVGGVLTNLDQIKKNLETLEKTEKDLQTGKLDQFTKKERLLMERKVKRDKRLFGGLLGMEKLPKALIIVDPKRDRVALREANKMGVPVVALVDTNTDPQGVDYIIPGNDDAMSSLELILATLAKALK
ncbi:MAG: 30S ribosomal protein S2 [bacterium]